MEDWKEKYFSADATAEALKAELKLKQSNLDQMKQNNQELKRDCNEKLAQIETLQNSSNQSLSDEQARVRDMQVKIDTLTSRLTSSEDKQSDLTTEISKLQVKYDKSCQNNDDLKGQFSEVQASLQEAQRHKSNL